MLCRAVPCCPCCAVLRCRVRPDVGGVNGELACGKFTTWEGGHRVPTIIRWPAVVPPGSVNQELTSSLDWYPTFASLVGYPLKEGVVYDGIENAEAIFLGGFQDNETYRHGAFQSSKDLVTQDMVSASKRKYFPYYSSSMITGADGKWPPLVAIRDRQFKLHVMTKGSSRHATGRDDWSYPTASVCAAGVQNWTARPLLFDLYKDPGENVPRTPLEGWDGTWPAPGAWHSGSMPADEYVYS
jgi:arylsulfatase A-like enzyme